MPRTARIVIPGCAHHITQRGNNRQDVFFVDDDRRAYLEILKLQSERFGLEVLGYCLMPNHVHLVAVPAEEQSLARVLGRTHLVYAQHVNRLHGRSGHLWQNRFWSCATDEDHFWSALRYIERNPVRAKLVRRAWRWQWSSAAAHCDGLDPTRLLDMAKWREQSAGLAWEKMLTEPEDERIIAALRLGTSRGRPLGSDRFLSKLETALGRRLRPLPVGRPRKKEKTG